MHLTPPLRVSRPISACARCRSAKVKCDGKLPACTACERAGKASECSSGTDHFARGKERSYVAALETRIERLERDLSHRRHDVKPLAGLEERRCTNSPLDSKTANKTEASDVDELVSDFGCLAVNATSNAYHGFDNEMSLARLVLSTAMTSELPRVSRTPLPQRTIAISLIRTCISEFFVFYPIMSFAGALGALERVYHHSSHLASLQDVWNVRIMLALGLSARSRTKGDAQYEAAAQNVVVAVESAAELIIAPGSLARLQSLLLLVMYSRVNSNTFDPWYLIGMAVRFMVEMGIHVTSGHYGDNSLSHMVNRRTLFHLVYALDRSISMSRIRPFSFSDESADLAVSGSLTPQDILANEELGHNTADDDYARQFLLLLQEQSKLYYSLYHVDRLARYQSWTQRLSAIQNNAGYLPSIPGSAKAPIRARFLIQIHYFAMLLLLPLEDSVNTVSAYGKSLAIEAACSYAEAVQSIAGSYAALGASVDDDYRTTSLVSRRLLQLVRNWHAYEHPRAIPQGPSYEPSQQETNWDLTHTANVRVTEALRSLDTALASLSAKFGSCDSYKRWTVDFEDALQILQQSLTAG